MIDFFKNPDELVAKFKSKDLKTSFDYDEIRHEAHKRVFTIAKMINLDLLKDMQNSISRAINDGITFDEWKKDIIPHLKKSGWWGEVKVKDPKTGKEKDIFVGSRRLKTIFDTNLRTTYAGAKKQSLDESSIEYYRYTAVLDSRTRPSHRKMHGKVFHKDHPFWKKNFPPNGWGCRCSVRGYTKDQLKKMGITPQSLKHPDIADKDFAYNITDHDLKDEFYKKANKKLKNTPKIAKFESERNLYVWQKGLDEMVDEIIVKKNYKSPINAIQVGMLNKEVMELISKFLPLKNRDKKGLILTKDRLYHARPERKGEYNHDFSIDEMRQIVKILSDESKIYVDLRDNHNNIVFIFDDVKDAKRLNLIPIEMIKTHKKFKDDNYIITLDKVDKIDIENWIKGKKIVKLK
ncbi:phage minor head protein [Campylobacter corcagiensis]|uniref:phage head morphogenesis protein n=1 Tax=Campylobacter corcagiensis TaxID=1448857 RepID=UPI0004B6F4A8|nr:phage minor head protein [Campylobacter corcagiensis]QKF64571.1 phage Mu protein F-like protein [Campylobacter corcagiensis]